MRTIFFYLVGLLFLTLAKIKQTFFGYTTPKPFSSQEVDRCIAYDMDVVDKWLVHLRSYAPAVTVNNASVLELGPGSDLGIGWYLLFLHARSYQAVDINQLAQVAQPSLYEALFQRLALIDRAQSQRIEEEYRRYVQGKSNALRYTVEPQFAISKVVSPASVDLIVSQAAFEHFSDVEKTIAEISQVIKPGGRLVAEVDLQTHSRWVRENDPNSIYRYPDWLYNCFQFPGIPNRVRPWQYKEYLKAHGWKDIRVIPTSFTAKQIRVAKQFQDPKHQMEILTFILCATKA